MRTETAGAPVVVDESAALPELARFRVLSVLGTRPEIVQAAALSVALRSKFDEIIVNTGQHYDAEMDADLVADTGLPIPSYNLGLGIRGADRLDLGRRELIELIACEDVDAVIVRGDTDATLAGARAAADAGIPLIHVEAGLRSFRGDMPEERNRVETDRLSQLLLAPTETARVNLERERVDGQVCVTGDVLLDMLLRMRPRLAGSGECRPYALATVHRSFTTDDHSKLAAALACLGAVPFRVILPLHPRTRVQIDLAAIDVPANVEVRDPLPYSSMLALERDAEVILTDSGGVQREAYMWGVRCITLRDETEWVETVSTGWNTLVGLDADRVAPALDHEVPLERPAVFGNGFAALCISEHIERFLRDARA